MNSFVIAVLVMFGLAFMFILPPLLRKNYKSESESIEDATNLTIGREHLTALKDELMAGDINEQQYQQAKGELEKNLAQSISSGKAADQKGGRHIWIGLILFLSIPVSAFVIYLMIGTPEIFSPEMQAPHQISSDETMESMIGTLQEHINANPKDGEAWMILGQSYLQISQFQKAQEAYKQAHAILGDNADLLANYADAIARSNNNNLTDEAKPLIKRALELDPNHQKALWLAGMLAYQDGEFDQVAKYLEPLLLQTEPNSEVHQSLKRLIELSQNQQQTQASDQGNAQANIKQSSQPTSQAVALQVKVSLSPELQTQVNPEDTVFIFAKAVQGPPMPLAVARLKAKELPVSVILDDSMAMRPELKISSQARVAISARISKTGNAIASSGDLQGDVVEADTHQPEAVEILINKAIP